MADKELKGYVVARRVFALSDEAIFSSSQRLLRAKNKNALATTFIPYPFHLCLSVVINL